jgi:Leucine-rich repeat (LRR) protein
LLSHRHVRLQAVDGKAKCWTSIIIGRRKPVNRERLARMDGTDLFDDPVPTWDDPTGALSLIDRCRAENAVELDLSRHRLHEIPPQVFSLKQLQVLKLSFNSIAVLPRELQQLEQLLTLDVGNNVIAAIDGLPPNLVTLELQKNRLRELSGGLRVPRLARLSLSGNPGVTLPG